MLRCAERGEWLQLADVEAQRYAFITAAMHLQDAEASEACAQSTRRILEIDQRTMALAQAGHSELAKQLRSINTGRNAVHAYNSRRAEVR